MLGLFILILLTWVGCVDYGIDLGCFDLFLYYFGVCGCIELIVVCFRVLVAVIWVVAVCFLLLCFVCCLLIECLCGDMVLLLLFCVVGCC